MLRPIIQQIRAPVLNPPLAVLVSEGKKQVKYEVHLLVNTRTRSRGLGRARTVHKPNHTSTTSGYYPIPTDLPD